MQKIVKFLAVSAAVVSLNGCLIVAGDRDVDEFTSSSWTKREASNRELINELKLQVVREEVERKLGTPDFLEAFAKGDDEYFVLYYRTHHAHSDGDTTRDETTPLIFKNNRLIGWGQDTLSRIM